MKRRQFITGLAGILVASTAPSIVRAASIMPVKPAFIPKTFSAKFVNSEGGILIPDEIASQMVWEISVMSTDNGKSWKTTSVQHVSCCPTVPLGEPLVGELRDGERIERCILAHEDSYVIDTLRKAGVR